VLAIGLMSACGLSMAASFDCGYAQTKVEQLICRNPDLSKLDEEMGGLYKAIESETAGVDGETGAVINPLGEEQATWLEQVRNKCATTSCLQRAYIERICAMKTNWKDALP
jgi:uncharacterized protein